MKPCLSWSFLCRPGWPSTDRDLSAASYLLELKACGNMSDLFYLIFFFDVKGCLVCMYIVSVHHVCSHRGQKKAPYPWNWSCRCLSAFMWVLGLYLSVLESSQCSQLSAPESSQCSQLVGYLFSPLFSECCLSIRKFSFF